MFILACELELTILTGFSEVHAVPHAFYALLDLRLRTPNCV
jgi:hypothetical protein